MMNEKNILTRQQTADYLSIGLTSLDRLINKANNPLPHIRLGARRIVIPKDQLDQWLESETIGKVG